MDQNQITSVAISEWLTKIGIRSGHQKFLSKDLWERFLRSESANGLLLKPSLKKFTLDLSGKLPKAKTAKGTIFFCEVKNEN